MRILNKHDIRAVTGVAGLIQYTSVGESFASGFAAISTRYTFPLLTALASDTLKLGFKLGTFPPTINSDAIVGALVAAVIISVVSALASVALSPRKLL